MKTFSAALQAHLDGRETTMCYCWRLTRNDGEVQGFTDHDRDLVFDSTTFHAATGFTASVIEQSLGLSVDNLNVDSALSDETINELDLAVGRYDGALVELFWVNWSDVTQRYLMSKGNIGEVKREQTAFSAELRSLTQKTQQRTGRTYQRYCDAILGDTRCAVNVEALTENATIGTVLDTRTFKCSLSNSIAFYYALGKLRFTSGPNADMEFEVKYHRGTGSGSEIELWTVPPFDISATHAFRIYPGCPKDMGTCASKFSNITRFRGFPHIPGNDAITKYPKKGAGGQDGLSIFR